MPFFSLQVYINWWFILFNSSEFLHGDVYSAGDSAWCCPNCMGRIVPWSDACSMNSSRLDAHCRRLWEVLAISTLLWSSGWEALYYSSSSQHWITALELQEKFFYHTHGIGGQQVQIYNGWCWSTWVRGRFKHLQKFCFWYEVSTKWNSVSPLLICLEVPPEHLLSSLGMRHSQEMYTCWNHTLKKARLSQRKPALYSTTGCHVHGCVLSAPLGSFLHNSVSSSEEWPYHQTWQAYWSELHVYCTILLWGNQIPWSRLLKQDSLHKEQEERAEWNYKKKSTDDAGLVPLPPLPRYHTGLEAQQAQNLFAVYFWSKEGYIPWQDKFARDTDLNDWEVQRFDASKLQKNVIPFCFQFCLKFAIDWPCNLHVLIGDVSCHFTRPIHLESGGGGALEGPGIPHEEKPDPSSCTVGVLGVDIEQGSRIKTGATLHLELSLLAWGWSHILGTRYHRWVTLYQQIITLSAGPHFSAMKRLYHLQRHQLLGQHHLAVQDADFPEHSWVSQIFCPDPCDKQLSKPLSKAFFWVVSESPLQILWCHKQLWKQ